MSPPSTQRTISQPRRPLVVSVAILALAGALTLGLATRDAEGASPTNVIFILTDDQTAGELAVMPNTQALIGSQGATFRRAYASYPLCCPSRATLLSGQYMHNHGIRGNLPPFGGWENFKPHEPDALPVWTKDSGYYNIQIGKYMNGYGPTASDPAPVPDGWDEWYGKVSEPSVYFNYNLLEKTGPSDGPEVKFYGGGPSDYQTDVLGQKAREFIDGLDGSQQPFMMNLWFNAPHGPFEPAPRHLFTLAGAGLPKVPGFNEKNISDKPRWLQKQARKRFGKGLKRTITSERLRRVEQLLSVDEAVRRLFDSLSEAGILDETYIIFASDNGFFRGEHRIVGGKYLPYDPSSKVPLLIRGPGIPAGAVSDELVSLTDLPETILEIAGSPDPSLDGRSLLPYAQNPASALGPPDPARGRYRPRSRQCRARRRLVSEPRAHRRRQGEARRQEGRQEPRPGEGPDQVAEVRRQRELRPRLQGNPHRPLPLRPLRQRADRALRHALRPGAAPLVGGRPAVQAGAQLPLQCARLARHLRRRRLPRRPPSRAAAPEAQAEGEEVGRGKDSRGWPS